MGKPLPLFKQHALRTSAFRDGSTLCPGCTESMTFHGVGRATHNGRKTIITMGTFCGEVSTLMYPNVVAWGRGDKSPDKVEDSLSIIHNVFESSPTLGEAVRDTATILEDLGAWKGQSPNVVSMSGDGGALSIGLRTFLHTIHRRARITIVVNINEVFANTGFQYSPTSLPYADSSTLPQGGMASPIDHIGLAITAGAAFVAQVSPGFPPLFAEVFDEAVNTQGGTAVVFVPSPCIAGWKFEEGQTAELAKLASQTGLFPCFRYRAGKGGELKNVAEKSRRPPVEKFLAGQRRFDHLIQMVDGQPVVRKGMEDHLATLQSYADQNVARLEKYVVRQDT
jgi:pyruvate ferredoxin oxidoreductase beta subunit